MIRTELTGAVLLIVAAVLIYRAARDTLAHAKRSTDWCDHEGSTRYVGHVLVDMRHGHAWVDGVAPAFRCSACLCEWTGAAEPMRRGDWFIGDQAKR
jgi:hypothetical protein